jgi:NADPH-dependent curcumin reductase CurA
MLSPRVPRSVAPSGVHGLRYGTKSYVAPVELGEAMEGEVIAEILVSRRRPSLPLL